MCDENDMLHQIKEACKRAKATLKERFPYGFGSDEQTDRVIKAKIDEYDVTVEVAEANLRDGHDVSDILQYFVEEEPVRR
jgi:hypothetical protein